MTVYRNQLADEFMQNRWSWMDKSKKEHYGSQVAAGG